MIYLIFDFDGTIADTFNKAIEISGRLYPELAKNILTDTTFIKEMHLREILKKYSISPIMLMRIAYNVKKELHKDIENLDVIPGIIDVLKKIKKNNNYEMSIISSNNRHNIIKFLNKNNINFFKHIYTTNNIFGKSAIIKQFIKKNNIPTAQTFYIGDESRDIEAAHKSSIKSIAVTWGFNTEKLLLKEKPDFIINRPEDLLNIIKLKHKV